MWALVTLLLGICFCVLVLEEREDPEARCAFDSVRAIMVSEGMVLT